MAARYGYDMRSHEHLPPSAPSVPMLPVIHPLHAMFALAIPLCGRPRCGIQHALLVHEGGFFSDEKGRLGRFSTIEALLESKISALARYPLSFRRENGRCERRWLPGYLVFGVVVA